jgi:DNA-binding transcriptional LysR family regulator
VNLPAAKKILLDGPLLYVPTVPQSAEVFALLAPRGLLPVRRIACGSFEMAKQLVLAGLGVAVVPQRVAAYTSPRLRRLHPALPAITDTISLIYRADVHKTRALLRLKDAMIAHGESLDA